jgi:hypothetical protein
MTIFPTLAVASPLVAGLIWIVKSAFIRPRTVPEMVGAIDIQLANRLYELVESRTAPVIKDQQFWKAVGGITGVPHLLSQARLLVSIVIEIRKVHPDLFEWEAKQLHGITWFLFKAIISRHAESCAARFCDLSADVEVLRSLL